MVDITLESIFEKPLSLAELKTFPALAKMELLRKGSRLSVQPFALKNSSSLLSLVKPENFGAPSACNGKP